jgi:hypothetical protein
MRIEEGERQLRRQGACAECGESRELAAHGLCFACYRRHERERKRERSVPDVPGLRKDQAALLKAHANLLALLGKIRVSEADITEIRRVLDRYFLPIVDHVVLVDATRARQIQNGEQLNDEDLGLDAEAERAEPEELTYKEIPPEILAITLKAKVNAKPNAVHSSQPARTKGVGTLSTAKDLQSPRVTRPLPPKRYPTTDESRKESK